MDILEIHNKILRNFQEEKEKIQEYREKLADLQLTRNSPSIPMYSKNELDKTIESLENKINKIENAEDYNYYIIETSEILKRYDEILRTPIKISFLGKQKTENREKNELIQKYLKISQKYIRLDCYKNCEENKKNKEGKDQVCEDCGNNKDFTEEENILICLNCGLQYESLINRTSYRDADRVNISTKYTYDRKIHFRDCMNQYQGKQNCTIEPKVYKGLEDIIQRHHLLVGNPGDAREYRYQNITKEHVLMFLKELGFSKHYENVVLIHYVLTGKKPDDISYIEDKLLNDFDLLVDTYDKNFKQNSERVNFISTQYVLFQLLQKHKHPCKKEDFVILKTVDRKTFHDDVCKELFAILGWNFIPLY